MMNKKIVAKELLKIAKILCSFKDVKRFQNLSSQIIENINHVLSMTKDLSKERDILKLDDKGIINHLNDFNRTMEKMSNDFSKTKERFDSGFYENKK